MSTLTNNTCTTMEEKLCIFSTENEEVTREMMNSEYENICLRIAFIAIFTCSVAVAHWHVVCSEHSVGHSPWLISLLATALHTSWKKEPFRLVSRTPLSGFRMLTAAFRWNRYLVGSDDYYDDGTWIAQCHSTGTYFRTKFYNYGLQ